MTVCVHPLILAHRGASADYPENTVAAFQAALEQGCDGIELDMRLTSDGVAIVNHDPWYHDLRMVHEHPSSARPEPVPTLSEALAVCAPGIINVEIKGPTPGLERDPDSLRAELCATALEEIADCPGDPDVVISSFDPAILKMVRDAGGPPTAVLTHAGFTAASLPALISAGHSAVNPHHSMVDEDLVSAAREAGVSVNVWTVDDPRRLVELADLGVDAVITNVPAAARHAIESRGS